MKSALELISLHVQNGLKLREDFFKNNAESIHQAALEISLRMARGGKLFICGNGGSVENARHMAAKFVNRYQADRPALPALALTADSSISTAVSGEQHFNRVFSRQLEALANAGDALFAISDLPDSENILEALKFANRLGMLTIGLAISDCEEMPASCEFFIAVPGDSLPLAQEIHLSCAHIFCALVDYYLFENVGELKRRLLEKDL